VLPNQGRGTGRGWSRAVTAASIAHLKITLDDVEPVVMRRVDVPLTIRLDRLHLVLQAALGWTNRQARREGRGNRVRILTSVPSRGFSLSLGPDLSEFRHEGIEQTGREKPIGVGITRAGEGAQVEARPRKFVHLVDNNP
jgi:hypothetical protein